ncbi:hypothetical protein [uncultured Lutibacter sp.]|uniref:beta strand repeat-containing protein n=1 Tax=uncultured Lutibacter sp. TaxID=437739 RepID=UPI00260C6C69|nr:hypothetical protein [uncultured Lutibacter sp.]
MKTKILAFILFLFIQFNVLGQAVASSNYAIQTGVLGAEYSWIDSSSGTLLSFSPSQDDGITSIPWPFNFSFYDNNYTSTSNLSIASNGFIRLDGDANTSYTDATNYNLTSADTSFGQIIALALTDGNTSESGSSVKYLVTGSSPNRILTIEYNNLEIDWNDNKYADVQVSFYETENKIVLKLGQFDITEDGVDMGLHSGVNGYFNKWQELKNGTENTYIEYTRTTPPVGPLASWNYGVITGSNGTTYNWIDCSLGDNIVSGNNKKAEISWPFDFRIYDNNYTTDDYLSVTTNGFIRFDDLANTRRQDAESYDLTSAATQLGQIIGLGVYGTKVGDNGGWVKSLVTGNAPQRVFTIEYNNLEIDRNDKKYADLQVSFYESTNKIVLKLGSKDITKTGVDMGLHSGVSTFFNKWQEVQSGTENTWIEYTPPFIEVNATLGTSLAYYSSLKDAFDKINTGTHRGNITIKINDNTVETSSAVLNASGSGLAEYAIVNIYPTKSGLSISGNLSTPLIDLNGADNVIFDGRVNGLGLSKDLSFINNSTSSTAGTSTFRFINGAKNNTIKYCEIKGSETNTSSGVLFFSTTSSFNSNDNNTIENNDISTAITNERPVNVIYSSGISGGENRGNIISANNIYNFFNSGIASNGIFLSTYTTDWIIESNSFYETLPFTGTAAVGYNAIRIDNTGGNNFNISDNFIGGSSPQCNGSAWAKTNATNNTFNAISLNVGTSSESSIQNNTIRNFNWSNSANGSWTGIQILGGNVNVGNVTGNTIGSLTENNLVTVTGSTSGLNVYGIHILSAGTVNCQKNNIGSITTANGGAFASNIFGINKSSTPGSTTISNNFIGSTTVANNINASSASTSNNQVVYGIYNNGFGVISISNNTISSLTNGTTNTSTGTLGVVQGINSNAGSITVSNNNIFNLVNSNANIEVNNNASVCGISLTGTTSNKTIKGNIVYNLSNTNTLFSGAIIGLYYAGSTVGNNVVSENFIHSLTVDPSSSNGSIYGLKIESGTTIYSNNIINLGGDTATNVYGVYETGIETNNNTLYFNTIYIEGNITSGSTEKSYALFSNASTNTRDIRNNIFMNARSTVGGTNLHYGAYFNYSSNTNITLDFNNYFVLGTGGVPGFYNGVNKSSLPIVSGQDLNSLSINPIFKNAGGTNYLDYIASGILTGVDCSILLDFEGITRDSPPKIGALESSLPFVWEGTVNNDFSNPSNWENGAVPPNGANITFATSPTNDCYLDQNRTLRKITNTSNKKFVLNGKQLTLTYGLVSSTLDQIDATSISSTIVFAGSSAQNLTSSNFTSNTIYGLIIDNSNGLNQDGDIIIENQLTLTNGAFSIGANTLTINGNVTTTLGTLIGGNSSNIIIGGNGANTSIPSLVTNNFELNRSNGISLEGDLTVTGSLDLINGSLTLDGNTLTIATNTINITDGDIVANQTSDTVDFQNTTGYTIASSLFNNSEIENFTISGEGGITLNNNLTVIGVLNLQNSNPSATKGLLDVTYTDDSIYNELIMGPNSTTEGHGDVTGVISRYSFIEGNSYTFGNKNTFAAFNIGALSLPTFLKARVTIGTAISGNSGLLTDPIKRSYDLIQSGGDKSIATFRASYLDSELNGNVKEDLSFWTPTNYSLQPPPVDSGRSNFNLSENWLELADVNISFFPSVFGYFPITMDESGLSYKEWIGEYSTDWNNSLNWIPSGVPDINSFVRIPDASTTNFDPTLPSNEDTEIMKIVLESGSILNSGNSDNAILTLTDNIGTWSNNGGTFNAGNSTIKFIRKDDVNHLPFEGITTISGNTTFNDIYVGELTTLSMVANTTMKISGAIIINEVGADRGVLNTTFAGETIVEYNGANQTVVIPNTTSNTYSTLILSGTGIKTMPGADLIIKKDFKLDDSATATALSSITVKGETHVEASATFITGAFNHYLEDLLDIDGMFTTSIGNTITLNGIKEQLILGDAPVTFNNLKINNANNVKMLTDIEISNNLILSNGNLNVGEVQLDINGGVSKTNGFIFADFDSSLAFGNTSSLVLPSNLFYGTATFKNLTINSVGGVIMGQDLTINGILDLQSVNPTSSIGSLDTGNNTLFMSSLATTTGLGDVTGTVRREHIFDNNKSYSFGNVNTNITFDDTNLKPTWVAIKIAIGTVPTWASYTPNGQIKRLYQIARSENASSSLATINMHYLPSELDGTYNDESQLTFWHKYINYSGGTPHEHGPSNQDFVNYSLQITGFPLGSSVTENLSESEVTMAYSLSTKNTWLGIVAGHETEWEQPNNWTRSHVPLSTEEVLIPGGLTHYPSLTSTANAVANTLEIALGASITANSETITISGAGGAWENRGTFYPGTGKVLFNHGLPNEIVTIAGETDFYDIEVAENTTFQPVAGNILRISGAGTAYASSIVDLSSIDNTVEWTGANQTIVNPNGIGGDSGYYNLIIGGSGTKTMPTNSMNINGNFSVSGTTSVTAAESIFVQGNTTIETGSSFATGNFNHSLGGDFENNGTFIGTSGGMVTFNGTLAQSILGTSSSNFDNLAIDNLLNVNLISNINVNNELQLLGGNLLVGNSTLGINGTISNPSGAIEVNSASNLVFGGASALTLNNNLFSNNPQVNNLTINRSGGVSLSNQSITVNGVLDAISGTLNLLDNTLTFSGSSPIRTTGTIDASSTNSGLIFSNTSSINLPVNLFAGDITNFTVNGSGGVISNGDISITGFLNLESNNPSLTKGSLDMASSSIIDMGENAITMGIGDVTGIVRRQHTFLDGIEYSFGNKFTSLNFLNVPGGIKPTWVKCKISIGDSPSWRSDAINRIYSFAQSGGTDRMIVKLHYLDNELHSPETDESKLVFWDAYDETHTTPNSFDKFYPRSFNFRNGGENWIQLSGPAINYIATSNLLDVKQWSLSYSNVGAHLHTWTGNGSPTYDGDWSLPGNWDGGVPEENCPVLIPHPSSLPSDNNGDFYPSKNLLPTISPAFASSMEIASGATLEIEEDYTITIFGNENAWVNNGVFIPGTATVVFDHPYDDDFNYVSISGTTNFYNVTITDETYIQPENNSVIRIENLMNFQTSSILDFSTTNNTIEYNGADQGVINPNGGATGYNNLILSGTGIKSLPTNTMQILNDFSLTGSASAITKNNLTVGRNLDLASTSNLTIAGGRTLTVNGNITNSVGYLGFLLKSTTDGTASLIHNTDNVQATVERYISGNAEDWHLLSSPVSNQTIVGSNWLPSGSYGNGTGYDLYVWDEPTPCWVYQPNLSATPSWSTVHPASNFVPGRGYLYSVEEENPTNEFKGNLNNGTISYPITANSTADPLLKGFNLIGNPYPSAIDWKSSSGWTRSNLIDSGGGYDMWIWNPAANNYGVFNSSGTTGTNSVNQYIASMQGFFVRAESNANISMTNNVRLHTGASNWMKPSKSTNILSSVKVRITSDSGLGFDEVLFQFGHNSNEFGAAKLFSTIKEAPSTYLNVGKENLSVRYLTDTIDNPMVPIMFKPGKDGKYTLNIEVDYGSYNYLILEDKKTETLHNLLENPNYKFQATLKDNNDRFVVHFKPIESIPEVSLDLSALIYYNENQVIVDLSSVKEKTNVKIVDMLGRLILSKTVEGNNIHYFNVPKTTQILIVTAKSENKIKRKKILIN